MLLARLGVDVEEDVVTISCTMVELGAVVRVVDEGAKELLTGGSELLLVGGSESLLPAIVVADGSILGGWVVGRKDCRN